MEQSDSWFKLSQLAIAIIPTVAGGLIGYLSYLNKSHEAKDKDRELQEKRLHENKEMYIKMVVRDTIDLDLKAIHDLIKELNKRIDNLFTLLKK